MSPSRNSLAIPALVFATVTASLLPIAAQAQDSYAGNIVGGIAGALLGSQVGRGNGKIAATAAGGILGAIVGGNVERGSSYRQSYNQPQQGYYDSDRQPPTQYQNSYNTVTYAQPAYAEPVYAEPVYAQPIYAQPTYVYAQPETTYVYVQRDQGRHNWRDRDDRDDEHRQWHRDHERGDDFRRVR